MYSYSAVSDSRKVAFDLASLLYGLIINMYLYVCGGENPW